MEKTSLRPRMQGAWGPSGPPSLVKGWDSQSTSEFTRLTCTMLCVSAAHPASFGAFCTYYIISSLSSALLLVLPSVWSDITNIILAGSQFHLWSKQRFGPVQSQVFYKVVRPSGGQTFYKNIWLLTHCPRHYLSMFLLIRINPNDGWEDWENHEVNS
jgi:hypothetical protein